MWDEADGLGTRDDGSRDDDVRIEVVYDADLGIITAMFDEADTIVMTMCG